MTSKRSLLLASFLSLTGAALAWVPKLDEPTTKAVIDTAYDRALEPVRTFLTLDLSVKDGRFAAGDGVVQPYGAGNDACVQAWLQDPAAYARAGSRPVSVTLTGQADEVFLQAQRARDEFRNLSVQEALAPREGRLPDGHLRVYVQIAGLAAEKLRDAYMLALRGPDGKLTQPYRRAFTNDWQRTEAGHWTGSMVYYFDAAKAGIDPNGKLALLLRTEADTNCAYQFTADLGTFR